MKYREHTAFANNKDLLSFYQSSYLGGDSYMVEAHLHQHPRETDKKYKRRLERAYYLNYTFPVVRIYTQHVCGSVTRVAVNESEAKEFEKTFYPNVTGDGLDLFSFFRDQSDLSSVFGYEGVLIDGTKAIRNRPEVATRVADDMSKPVLRKVDASNIIDWSIDSRGRLNWVLIRSIGVVDSNPDVDRAEYLRMELWTRTGVRYFQKAEKDNQDWDGEFAEQINEKVDYDYEGTVPFVFVRHSRTLLDGIPASMIKDIAHVNKSIFNYTSLRDSCLYDQTFSILTLPTDGEEGEEFERTVGENNFLTFSSYSNHAPSWITPPPTCVEALSGVIRGNVEEIFRIAVLDKSGKSEGEQYATAYARMIDSQDTNSALKEKAELMEAAEREVSTMYNRVRGKTGLYWKPTYPKSFDVRAFTQELADALQEDSLNMGTPYMIAVKKQLADKRFPNMETQDLTKIYKGIEEATVEIEVPPPTETGGGMDDKLDFSSAGSVSDRRIRTESTSNKEGQSKTKTN